MADDFSDVVSIFSGGVRLAIKAKPGFASHRPSRLVDIGNGKRALEVTVAEAAKDGKANQAILKQLAMDFGLRKAALKIKSRITVRLKLIEIAGDPADLQKKLILWLSSDGF